MAYTFIFIRRDSTDTQPLSVNVPVWLFWTIVTAIIALPFIVVGVNNYVLAPKYLGERGRQTLTDLAQTTQELTALKQEHQQLSAQYEKLKSKYDAEQDNRSQVEARVAIAETAKAESASRMHDLQAKVDDLQKRVDFYEEFIKPETERDVLQCFNIDVNGSGNTVNYGVNFMKSDRKDKERISTKVAFRVLSGSNLLAARSKEEAVEPAKTDTISFSRDVRIKGTIDTKIPEKGLRVLDIKAYDSDDKVIAHCWETF